MNTQQQFVLDLLKVEHNPQRAGILLGLLDVDNVAKTPDLRPGRFGLGVVEGFITEHRFTHAAAAVGYLSAEDLDVVIRSTKNTKALNAVMDAHDVTFASLLWLHDHTANASVRRRVLEVLIKRAQITAHGHYFDFSSNPTDVSMGNASWSLQFIRDVTEAVTAGDDDQLVELIERYGNTATTWLVNKLPVMSPRLQHLVKTCGTSRVVVQMLYRPDVEHDVTVEVLERLLNNNPVLCTFDLVDHLGDWAVELFAQHVDRLDNGQLCQLLRDRRCPEHLVQQELTTEASVSCLTRTGQREAFKRFCAAQRSPHLTGEQFTGFVTDLLNTAGVDVGGYRPNWKLLTDTRVDPAAVVDAVCLFGTACADPVTALLNNPRVNADVVKRIRDAQREDQFSWSTEAEVTRALAYLEFRTAQQLLDIATSGTTPQHHCDVVTHLVGLLTELGWVHLNGGDLGSLEAVPLTPAKCPTYRYVSGNVLAIPHQVLLHAADQRLPADADVVELMVSLGANWQGTVGSLLDAVEALR